MRIYAIALVAALAMILTAALVARRRLKPACPHCGARDAQQTIAERQTSGGNVMYAARDWFASRGEERLRVRRQDVVTATLKCAKCGEQYERSRVAERKVLG